MTVRCRSAVPVFLVSDVDATARWYAEQLGFRTTGLFPPTPPASWASLERDGAEIMLQRLAGHQNPDLYARRRGGVWNAYIRMSDGVKTLYESLQNQPFLKKPLQLQPYGNWEFEVVDPTGYVIVFSGE